MTQVRFAKEAIALPTADTWQFAHDALIPPQESEISVKMHYMSVGPAMKGWISKNKSYIEPVELGEVMRGIGVAEVIDIFPEAVQIVYQGKNHDKLIIKLVD